jgi:hypothetical protein
MSQSLGLTSRLGRDSDEPVHLQPSRIDFSCFTLSRGR